MLAESQRPAMSLNGLNEVCMFEFALADGQMTPFLLGCTSPDTNVKPMTSLPETPTLLSMDNALVLEQEFCSNFTCCGLALPSFHDLIDHFESIHVLILDEHGQPRLPSVIRPPAALTTPVSPGSSSSTCSSASTSSPNSPNRSDHGLDESNVPGPLSIGTLGKPYSRIVLEFPYSPPTPAPLAPEMDTEWLVDEDDIQMDVDTPAPSPATSESPSPSISGESILSSSPSSSAGSPTSEHFDDSSEGSPPWRAMSNLRMYSKPTRGRPVSIALASAVGAASSKSMAKAKARILGSRPSGWRERAKGYQCPKEGCVKQYMNPGGLKYHLEKGTCVVPVESAN